MNATLQATLNLKVVQEKLTHQTPESVTQSSTITPKICKTVCNSPPKTQEGVSAQQKSLRKVPSLTMLHNNDSLDVIDPLLCWFEHQ